MKAGDEQARLIRDKLRRRSKSAHVAIKQWRVGIDLIFSFLIWLYVFNR